MSIKNHISKLKSETCALSNGTGQSRGSTSASQPISCPGKTWDVSRLVDPLMNSYNYQPRILNLITLVSSCFQKTDLSFPYPLMLRNESIVIRAVKINL